MGEFYLVDNKEKHYEVFENREIYVGRGTLNNDITIKNACISRKHCKFYRKGSEIYVQDLGSFNGTFVNKKRIKRNEKVRLNIGDIVVLADVVDFKLENIERTDELKEDLE